MTQASTLTYEDKAGLKDGTSYTYKVTAFYDGEAQGDKVTGTVESVDSNTVSITYDASNTSGTDTDTGSTGTDTSTGSTGTGADTSTGSTGTSGTDTGTGSTGTSGTDTGTGSTGTSGTDVGTGTSGTTTTATATAKAGKVSNLKVSASAKGLKLTWSKASNATGYILYRKTGSGSYEKLTTIKKASTLSYVDTTVKNGNSYTYRLRAYNSAGKGGYTAAKTYRYLSRPSISKLTNPKAGKLKAVWTKNSKATGYQLQYSTSADFSAKKTVKIKDKTTLNKTISGLKKGKTFYVRIRAYKTVSGTDYYSAWSAVSKLRLQK